MSNLASSVRRDGERMVFTGDLDRGAATQLWPQASASAVGAKVLDVGNVASVDSAGLAMLVALARQVGITTVIGAPIGYAELRAAYRLDDALGFAAG